MSGLEARLGMGFLPVPAAPSPYFPETRRIVTRWVALGVNPTDERVAILDATFVRPIVGAGGWSLFDVLYLFGAHAEAAALVNLASPGTHDLVASGGPIFTTDDGVQGDGVDADLNPNLTLNFGVTASQCQQNSAHVGLYVLGSPDSSITFGQGGGTQRMAFRPNNSGALSGLLCSTVNASFGGAGGAGHKALARADAATVRGYSAGAHVGNATAVSSAMTGQGVRFLRNPTVWSANKLGGGHMGANLSDAQMAVVAEAYADFYAALAA